MRQLLIVVSLAIASFAPLAAHAQQASGAKNGVISPLTAGRFGLKRAWFTQIEVDRSRGRVTHVNQQVSNTRRYTVFEVKSPQGVEYITEREVDRWGQPLGKDGAEKLAQQRVQQLKDVRIEAEMKPLEVPEVTIYAQTDRGTLHALDGATGRTKWVTTVGNPDHPSLAPGANDKFVATVNGSYLYVLEQASGKLAWSRQISGAPGAGPAVSDDRVFVPTVSGMIEVYNLEEHRKPAWYYQSTGRLLVQPTISTSSASWATDRGYLYVCDKTRLGVRFRLEARDPIVAHSTFLPPNHLFAASTDGYVYCVHEFNGDVLWRFSVGDPISEPPVATREGIYVVADDAGMYCIGAEDGIEKWWAPRIRKLLAVSKERIYCISTIGQLVILDARTGGQIDAVPVPNLDLLYTNWVTDRIIVGTSTGVLQCLHEINSPWPIIHNLPDPDKSQKPKTADAAGEDEPAAEEEMPADSTDDPFGGGDAGGDDPFGGGGDEPAAGGDDDPFGGGDAGGDEPAADDPPAGDDDPFGGGAADAGDDPFGG